MAKKCTLSRLLTFWEITFFIVSLVVALRYGESPIKVWGENLTGSVMVQVNISYLLPPPIPCYSDNYAKVTDKIDECLDRKIEIIPVLPLSACLGSFGCP